MVYAFHSPHLLNPHIEGSAHRAHYRQHVLCVVLQGPALCFAAAGFSLFFYPAVSGEAEGCDCLTKQPSPIGWGGVAPRGSQGIGMREG